MPIPNHQNPHTNRAAIAPYNFVPLADPVVTAPELPPRDRYHPDRHTGVIHCTMLALTQLYTRAALEPEEAARQQEAKHKPDFFYIDPATKTPVIPGSGLRGVVRSLLEIVTNSKLQPVTDRQLFYRTMDGTALSHRYTGRMTGGHPQMDGRHPLAKAGYMVRRGNRYFMRPARSILGTQYYRVHEDKVLAVAPELEPMAAENQWGKWQSNPPYRWKRLQVWFVPTKPTLHKDTASSYAEVEQISTEDKSMFRDWHKGVLIASGWVPSKGRGKARHWIVGPPDDAAPEIAVDEIDIDAYRERGAGITQAIERNDFSVLPKDDGQSIACFYTQWRDARGKERIAFGHTAMFRLPYTLAPRDLLPPEHQATATVDLAEAIFGRVEEQGKAIAGRVYFGDAHLTSAPQPAQPIQVLLSGPKPTAVQQYLVQGSDEKTRLNLYDPEEDGEPATLRGHKLYWHRSQQALVQAQIDAANSQADARNKKDQDSSQITTLEPVGAGATFAFTIHFENLSSVELGALLWALELPGPAGENYCHKVGMGKPVGLGSVKVAATLHLSDRQARYRQIFDTRRWRPTRKAPAMPPTEHLNAFETFMLAALPDSQHKRLADLPRIRALLTILRWPGPGDAETRYMTIEPNEYRDRPVLPTPTYLADAQERAVADAMPRDPRKDAPQPKRLTGRAVEAPAMAEETIRGLETTVQQKAKELAAAAAAGPARLTAQEEAIPGRRVRGTIRRFTDDRLEVEIGLENYAYLRYKQIAPPVRDQKQAQARFAVGQEIEAVIMTAGSRVQLSMK
jgi:CRISPR-associated protein (TIGR03986 family)